MNIDTKNFNKTLANQIEEHVKKSLMNKLDFFFRDAGIVQHI